MMFEEGKIIPQVEELGEEGRAKTLLSDFGFADWRTAWGVLRRLESRNCEGLSLIYSFLMESLGSAGDPDRSLINFERFTENYGPELFQELKRNPRIIEILITLFSASPFLTEILLHTPDAIELLNDRYSLTEHKTIDQIQSEATSAMQSVGFQDDELNALRQYQRRQLLRIGTSDFLGLYDLRSVFSQLSRLGIGLVRVCLILATKQTGIKPSDFGVLALGKLGGWELNYSSDIDLLFISRHKAEDYLRLTEQLIYNIAETTSAGFLYRVDLRLRPWGKDGPLVTTLDACLSYFRDHARLWEKQAYLKARPIAGNLALGEQLRKEIEPFLFETPMDEVRNGIFAMKQRTEDILQKKGRNWGEVKLGEGSIRDIESVVQFLQITHPAIRTRAIIKAILRLRQEGILEPKEAHILTEGYTFLRTIEHYLQIIDYRQTYTLPSDPNDLIRLARKLGFEGSQAGEEFIERYEQYSRAIRSIFLKYIGNEAANEKEEFHEISPLVLQHIARMDASYTSTFTPREISHHTRLINKLDNETIVLVDSESLSNNQWRVTVVGYDYLGELSLICGLMFIYGLDIVNGEAFTYEPWKNSDPKTKAGINQTRNAQSKIVDVFTVRTLQTETLSVEFWTQYAQDLHGLLKKVKAGLRREAQSDLAKRIGEAFQVKPGNIAPLYPIEIEIDNVSSKLYSVLKINTIDTVGFLYEFSNALALSHINIARMFVQSIGNRVNDMVYITDEQGYKIESPQKIRELRAATVLIKHFTHLLPYSPNPASALLHFREFLGQLFVHPNWPDELVNIERPEVLEALAKLLGVSDFLWEDFLRMQYSNLFPVVSDIKALSNAKDFLQLQNELELSLSRGNDWRSALNAFKDREMFRIDMRHILGYPPEFWDFSLELTDLAEVVVTSVYNHCKEELMKKHGEPLMEDGSPCPDTLFALGKYGGQELGFASDIELMLIYYGNGKTSGPIIISNSDFFEELVRSIVKAIQARQEGIFHIDLQLRPYGRAGRLAVSCDLFQQYFAPDGPAWAYERQALVKLRSIAGATTFGQEICELRDRYIYNNRSFDVTAMRGMRERQIRHLVNAGIFNAKYSPGGLVDVEYLVQGLQIIHGGDIPSLRLTNIQMAMTALLEAGIISREDYVRLHKAHTFLCWLIDSLRVVRGNNKDVNVPPVHSEEFSFLARRLRYGADIYRLQEDLSRYSMDIQELNQRLLSA